MAQSLFPGQGQSLPQSWGLDGQWIYYPHLYFFVDPRSASQSREAPGERTLPDGHQAHGVNATAAATKMSLTLKAVFAANAAGTLEVTAESRPTRRGALRSMAFRLRLGDKKYYCTVHTYGSGTTMTPDRVPPEPERPPSQWKRIFRMVGLK